MSSLVLFVCKDLIKGDHAIGGVDSGSGLGVSWDCASDSCDFTVTSTCKGWVALGFNNNGHMSNTAGWVGGYDGSKASGYFKEIKINSPSSSPVIDTTVAQVATSIATKETVNTVVSFRAPAPTGSWMIMSCSESDDLTVKHSTTFKKQVSIVSVGSGATKGAEDPSGM